MAHDGDNMARLPSNARRIHVPLQPRHARKGLVISERGTRTVVDLTSALCSEDPGTRAEAYEAIGGYHGYDNFDSYPEDWNESQMSAWPKRGRMKITISTSDDDNGMVTLYCDDQDAARDDQAVEGSSWECPSDTDVAHASVTDRPNLLARLEKEYDVDSSEYSPPDADDLARWSKKAGE